MQSRTWNKLLEFETRDLIERFIRKKYNRSTNEWQVLQISSNFIQGREYFRNAKNSAITVKPLLQYYGVAALTRGLILACAPHIAEVTLKPSHGLGIINWHDQLVNKDFQNLTVNIQHGTFYELLKYTSNKSYFKHKSNGIDYASNFKIPDVGSQIKLVDLVQTFPDLAEEYETWTEKKLPFVTMNSFKYLPDNECEYQISKPWKYDEVIDELFPKNLVKNFWLFENKGNITIKTLADYTPHFSQMFSDPFKMDIGDIALTKPINGNIYLNPLAQFYALSYFLGMLSRYFPTVWISLGRTQKGDAVYPLFIRILEMIDTYFPTIVLEYLSGPYEFEKSKCT